MLRAKHPLFQSPILVDFSRQVTTNVPPAWQNDLEEPQVTILPLVDDRKSTYRDGWCTYTYEHTQAPELEIICGGINAKTPKASAIWRQGHLLHFGFEQSPAEMNDNGRALLVNAISYITRYREDRPIIRRSADARILDRGAIDRLVKNEQRDLERYLGWFFSDRLRNELEGKSRQELAEWFSATRSYLMADSRGKFVVDEQAQQFGIPPDSMEFIPAAIARIEENGSDDELARDLLARYAPTGPGRQASSGDWQAWWLENRSYLFFSDTGGFRWYIDPLAKRREIPTQDLRGRARAVRSSAADSAR